MSPALAGEFFTTEPPGKPFGKGFDYLANLLMEKSLFRYFCFLIIQFGRLYISRNVPISSRLSNLLVSSYS